MMLRSFVLLQSAFLRQSVRRSQALVLVALFGLLTWDESISAIVGSAYAAEEPGFVGCVVKSEITPLVPTTTAGYYGLRESATKH